MPRHTVNPMSPIPVDPDGPGGADRSPEPLGAPHHERAPATGRRAGPATVRAFRMLLGNTLIANVTTSFLWFALTFWAYLETRSVMATAIIGGSYMLFLAVFGWSSDLWSTGTARNRSWWCRASSPCSRSRSPAGSMSLR